MIRAVMHLENGKPEGVDGIRNEMVKGGGPGAVE